MLKCCISGSNMVSRSVSVLSNIGVTFSSLSLSVRIQHSAFPPANVVDRTMLHARPGINYTNCI